MRPPPAVRCAQLAAHVSVQRLHEESAPGCEVVRIWALVKQQYSRLKQRLSSLFGYSFGFPWQCLGQVSYQSPPVIAHLYLLWWAKQAERAGANAAACPSWQPGFR